MCVLDFWTPALDDCTGGPVEPTLDMGPSIEHTGEPETLGAFIARPRRSGRAATLLVRETPHMETGPVRAFDRLRGRGAGGRDDPDAVGVRGG